MSTIIIYKSRQGATKQYVDWIAQGLDAEVLEAEKCTPEALEKADKIIIGSGIFAGKWDALPFLSANKGKLEGKKIALFVVGLNPPAPQDFEAMLEKAGVTIPNAQFFSFKGGLDYPSLSFSDKLIQNIVYLMFFKFKKSENAETRYIKENFFKGFALMKKEYVTPIVDFLK
ncbi:MAG: flavodoxin domain-containing protein [Brevinema sp.]